MMQDPKKIADWLIKRAGGSPAARLYIAAISKAKGLLLTPGEQGTTAVSVVADMKAQGVTVREAEAAGTAGAAAIGAGLVHLPQLQTLEYVMCPSVCAGPWCVLARERGAMPCDCAVLLCVRFVFVQPV